MKFTCKVTINKPIALVAKIFEDPDALKHCQEGFVSLEHLSGTKGQAGAKAKFTYTKFELLETIIHNKLPDEFLALYEHKHMSNTMQVNFIEIDQNTTQYVSKIHYTKFNGFFIKLMAKFFPKMFEKQVLRWMVKFKNYCEATN
ncbi:MAG: SRPBCC family protein [Oceanihabitans sp.]